MHHFQYLVYSRAPGDQEPFDRVFSSETSRREFLRRAAAVGISASAAVTLLGALAERTVAAAGTDILTAQSEAPSMIPGGWGAGYLAQYLQNLSEQTDPPLPLGGIAGWDIETDGPSHILMIAVDEYDHSKTPMPNGELPDKDPETIRLALEQAFVGHEVKLVELETTDVPLPDGMVNLPGVLKELSSGGTKAINSLIIGKNEDGSLAVQVTFAVSANVSTAQG